MGANPKISTQVLDKIIEVKKRKVALLGTVPHKLLAPFDNQEFEIWAIAHACLGDPLKRVDRIFEIHKWDEVIKWKSDQAWTTLHKDAIVYLNEKRKDVPQSVQFPFERMAEKFQIFDDREEALMTNSISWMIALAIDEGFEEIHVYGVNMSHHTEYGTQKPSCEYFLGLAKGMGIKIYVPTESDLCKSYFLYGRDEEKQADLMKKFDDRFQFLQGVHNQYKIQHEQARDAMNQVAGALELLKSQDQDDPQVQEKIKKFTAEWQKHRLAYEQGRDAIQQHIGAIEDVKYFQQLFRH